MLMKVLGVDFSRTVQYQNSGKEKNFCLVYLSSTKREFRHFNVVVVQRREKMYKKCTKTESVIRVQGCCFANLMLKWEILQKKNLEKKIEKQG